MQTDETQKLFENFEVPDPVRIRKVWGFVHTYFKHLNALCVLECGVCKGGLAELLSKEGVECYGVDINPRNIPGVKIYQADLNVGFPKFDREFDIIFAGEILEHMFDDAKFIRSCHKLLKPNGLLVMTVPNLVFIVNRLYMFFGKMPLFAYAPFHYHFYTKDALWHLVEREGFNILKCSSSHILFSTRRNKLGWIFEILGDILPSYGAHLIVYANKIAGTNGNEMSKASQLSA
jgi:SAM-dependent methyltransferase